MATTIEYALLAGDSYYDTRADINRFPIPTGWAKISNPDSHFSDLATGFEAISFTNGTEIVISFAGTYDKDYFGDWIADVKLATGYAHAQLLQAAQYYLDVKRQNPSATITLTGHSLGGGLAALVGVFFHVSATTFDQAPFANAAQSNSLLSNPLNHLTPDVAAELKNSLLAVGYTEAELAPLTSFLLIRPTDGIIPNSNLVSNIRVDGEFLFSLPIGMYDTIGNPATVITHGPHFSPSTDLHTQSLLTAFLQSDAAALTVAGQKQSLSEASKKLTNLLGMIFDGGLYSYRTDDTNHVNLLEHLVRHEAGVFDPSTGTISIPADAMVTRFTADLWQIAQEGGLTLNEAFLSRALTAFAMQKYYDETKASAGYNKTLFTGVTGGIQFDIKDVASTPAAAKGYADFRRFLEQYYTSVTTGLTGATVVTLNPSKDQILAALSSLRDWYIQAGVDAMNATDTHNRNAFMLGNTGNDILSGGTGNDLLVGNAGTDTLTGGAGGDWMIGGAGNDTLNGGTGYDTYTLEGSDTIRDSDGQGILKDKAGNIISGVIEKRADGTYAYLSDPTISVTLDTNFTLTMTLADGSVAVVENFTSGNLGLQLAGQTTVSPQGINGQEPLTGSNTLNSPNPAAPIIPLTQYNDRYWGIPDGLGLFQGLGGDDQLSAEDITNTDIATLIRNGNTQTDSAQAGFFLYGNTGNDTLVGGARQDELYGGAGQDLIIGGAGNDYIEGDAEFFLHDPALNAQDATPATGASDTLYAGNGDDTASGGQGNDVIYGEGGNDTLYGDDSGLKIMDNGAAITLPEALHGNDFIDGGDGNDTLWGDGGNDTLYGGAGDDLIYGDSLAQLVPGNDYLDGGDGNDTLYGNAGDDTVLGGAGDDKLYGGEGANYLDGGNGNDTLNSGGPGSASYGGAGDDNISATGGGNYLDGGDGADTLLADGGNNELFGGAGNDNLTASGTNNYLDGEEGTNTLTAEGGGNTLFAGAGDDTLSAGGGNNYLDGGNGTNTLIADGGNNTLIGGAGNDTLSAAGGGNTLDGGAGTNSLTADGGNNTLLSGAGNDYLSSSGGKSALDGGSGNDTLIADMGNNTLTGGLGDDTLSATGGTNTLDGGDGADSLVAAGGNNTLSGGAGDDNLSVYGDNNTLDGGSGNDTLYGDTGTDTLIGGAGNDTLQGGDGNDVYAYNIGDGVDHIVDSSAGGQINTLHFGTGISVTNIVLGLGSLMLDLGNGDVIHIDNFDPNNAANSSTIQRFEFADGTTLTAQQLVTTLGFDLAGTTGNDTLTGTSADDRISGGKGNDTLSGGAGNDTYLFNAGDGTDSIADNSAGGQVNTLRLGAGITAAQITSTTDSATGQVILSLANGDSIRVGTASDLAIQTIQLADGTRIGIADILPPPSRYSISGNVLTFSAGITPDMLVPRRTAGAYGQCVLELVDSAGQASGSITLGSLADLVTHNVYDINPFDYFDIKTIRFADGTSVSSQDFVMGRGLTQTGTAERDYLIGVDGRKGLIPDRLEGGPGNDILQGGGGSDIYVFNRGDGADTIKDGAYQQINPYWGQMPGGDNTLLFGAGITAASITATYQHSYYYYEPDKIVLDLGNGDSINIGSGANNLAVQNLQFADGTTMSMNDFLMQHGVTHTSVVAGWGNDWSGVQEYPNIMRGLGGDDVLHGGAFNDTLEGGTGNDYLEGRGGSDTYLYNRGDGADFIRDDFIGGNVLSFGAGITSNSITPVWDSAAKRMTLNLSPSTGSGQTGDRVVIGSLDDLAIKTLRFSDGQTMAMQDFLAQRGVVQPVGTADDNVMATFADGQTLRGMGGNDTLFGSVLDDTLEGGAGNDVLLGGAGNDTYLYNIGDGADTIVDIGEANTLSFGAGISANMITPVFDSATYRLTLNLGGGDSVNIGSVIETAIQNLRFADGTTLTLDEFMAQAGEIVQIGTADDDSMSGTPFANRFEGLGGNDYIYGNQSADTLLGGSGDDYLSAAGGDDTLVGGTGNDYLVGGFGNDTYYFNLGDGTDAIDDSAFAFQYEGDPLNEVNTLVFGAGITPDSVTNTVDGSGQIVLNLVSGDSVSIGYVDNLAIQKIVFSGGRVFSTESILSGAPNAQPIAGQVANQDTQFSFTIPAGTFADPNGDSMSYSAIMADPSASSGQAPLPAWLAFDPVTQVFSGTPTNGDVGALNVSVIATDTGGLSAASSFELTVTGGQLDLAPIAADDTVAVTDGTGATVISQAQLLANDTDPNVGDVLSIVSVDATSARGNTAILDAAGNVVFDIGDRYQSLGADQTANDSFTYTVSDAAGLTSTATVSVTIAGVNDAPVAANAIAVQTSQQDAAFSFTVPANTFTDIDQGDVLTYSATMSDGSALLSWLTFDSATQTFSGAPGNEDVGNLSVQVTATDIAGLSASGTFALDVLNVNDPPTANADAGAAIEDGGAIILSAATLLANDTDPDAIHGDTLDIVGVSQAASGAAVSLLPSTSLYGVYGSFLCQRRAGVEGHRQASAA